MGSNLTRRFFSFFLVGTGSDAAEVLLLLLLLEVVIVEQHR